MVRLYKGLESHDIFFIHGFSNAAKLLHYPVLYRNYAA
jgi:hypothetical protein